jgi:hypothetical protein
MKLKKNAFTILILEFFEIQLLDIELPKKTEHRLPLIHYIFTHYIIQNWCTYPLQFQAFLGLHLH